MNIPFTKAHGARNDFLLTWRQEVPSDADFPALARAICDRHTGVGADGWLLLSPSSTADATLELWNSDGSTSGLSGNGTRCAALYLIEKGRAPETVRIATGAGTKSLQLLRREDRTATFEMNMGRARVEELSVTLPVRSSPDDTTLVDAAIVDVGNPQCVVFAADFKFDWRRLGAVLERYPKFPNRTNVSFVRVKDDHTIEVRFWERGAGETMSSGTGSTGAAAAAVARGFVKSPVEVQTPAGPLRLRWEGEEILLAGPAEITAAGIFYC
jgi:diaminopimelate epimerase